MNLGVFDMFKVGIGPSSSHTVGPMRAAASFGRPIEELGLVDSVTEVTVELLGSLGATGRGHGTVEAVVLGLVGHEPEDVAPTTVAEVFGAVRDSGILRLCGHRDIGFDVSTQVTLDGRRQLPRHPNAMVFRAIGIGGRILVERTFYSVGGGFVLEGGLDLAGDEQQDVPLAFDTAERLLAHAYDRGISIAEVMLRNECAALDRPSVERRILSLWRDMQDCVTAGIKTTGRLPGGLEVNRRAPGLLAGLTRDSAAGPIDALEWVTLWALAVNEENAAGGRVVTAPTNGAAGTVPAVLHFYARLTPAPTDGGVVEFLATAAAIGTLFKRDASISGAEVGCQGEVGSACAMAAAGLAAALGGTPAQVENAAEIGIEHCLGPTCDPVMGLVQIPCIERNAMASVKAVAAARLALRESGEHRVSLDTAILTLRDIGADMSDKYKETARGGLALNFVNC